MQVTVSSVNERPGSYGLYAEQVTSRRSGYVRITLINI